MIKVAKVVTNYDNWGQQCANTYLVCSKEEECLPEHQKISIVSLRTVDHPAGFKTYSLQSVLGDIFLGR